MVRRSRIDRPLQWGIIALPFSKLCTDYEHGLVAALKDGLTGSYNRRYLDTHLAAQLNSPAAAGKPTSVVMLDIDHFKRINDTNGHAAGDDVLRQLVLRLVDSLRDFDTVARYGGEEFVVVLTGIRVEAATAVAKRLRERIAADAFQSGDVAITVTISAGVAEGRHGEHATDLLMRADAALYRAKKEGRNMVIADDETGGVALAPSISSSSL